MQKSKCLTYLGFAIKSGALRTGSVAVSSLKKAELVIVCASASDNAVQKAKGQALRLRCPLIKTTVSAEEITGKQNCRIMAVTDRNLADAIMNNLDDNFTIMLGGNKE